MDLFELVLAVEAEQERIEELINIFNTDNFEDLMEDEECLPQIG